MVDDDASLRVQLLARMGELRGLARRLARDDDPDDAVQDTAVVALSQRALPTSVSAWLRQVLRNTVRGRVRHRSAWDHRRFDPSPPEIPDTPEQNTATLELFELLRAALDDLEEPYRTTLRRRFFEGLSPADIAHEGGELPTTVRWRVHEGLRRMRARLDDRCGGRERWCGALVLAFDPFARSTEGASPMMHTSLTISLLAASAIAITAGVAVAMQTSAADPDAPTGVTAAAAALSSAESDPSALTLLDDAHEPEASCDPEPPEEPADDREPMQYFFDSMVDCFEAAPVGSLEGVKRLELDMKLTRNTVDEPLFVEFVHVTHGRKLMCADGVAEPTPIDAEGVVRHREIEECITSSIDPARFPTSDDGLTGGVFGIAVGLDGHGGLEDRDHAPPWQLPELPDEPVPDPNSAVAALELPLRGASGDDRIEVVACGGYSCSFSRKGDAQLEELASREPRLAVAWLQYPLPMHADGLLLSTAAVAAARQGKFWEMHRALFEHEKPMDRDAVLALAAAVGLDVARFTADLDDPATAVEVGRQHRVCETAGVHGTPSFFVDGDLLVGAVGADGLAKTIEELALLEK